MVLSSLYELPIGRGNRWGSNWSRPVDWALGGWQLNGNLLPAVRPPLQRVCVDGSQGNCVTRADLTGKAGVTPGSLSNYITGSFTVPASTGGVFNAPGTSGRDILRGPGSSNMDLALFKNVSFTEQIKAQFRVQAYNLTNTPHFANPDTDLSHGSSRFGHITGNRAVQLPPDRARPAGHVLGWFTVNYFVPRPGLVALAESFFAMKFCRISSRIRSCRNAAFLDVRFLAFFGDNAVGFFGPRRENRCRPASNCILSAMN